MVTNVLSSPPSVCQKKMTQRSASSASYEALRPFAPSQYNSVMDNVVGSLALAEIAKIKGGNASKLRLCIAGAGESHFASPSDCFWRSRRGSAFHVRDKVSDAERQGVCAQLVVWWKRLGVEWTAGDKSNVACWDPGCPVRMSPGGVGGGRILGITPEAAPWSTWEVLVDRRRNVRGLLFENVDAHGTEVDRLGRRAEAPSPGGDIRVYSSPSGKRIALPSPMSFPQSKMQFGSAVLSEEPSEQSVHPDKVDWRADARLVCEFYHLDSTGSTLSFIT